MRAYEVSLAPLGHRLAVAWHGGELAHSALWLRFADAQGHPLGKALQLTDAQRDAYEPDLQPFSGGLVVAWYEKDPRDGGLRACLARLDWRGHELWRRALSAADREGRNPVVRVAGRKLLVAWLEAVRGDAPVLRVAQFDDSGRQLGEPLAAADASRETWHLNAAVDASGNLYVVYDAARGMRAAELQLVRIDRAGRVTRRALSADDGAASTYPDIAIAGGRVAITWFDRRDGNDEVYLFVDALPAITKGDDALDITARAQRVTQGDGASTGAYVAWNGARLGLSWQEDERGAVSARFARFDAAGNALGMPGQLNVGKARALLPAIAPWHRGFAIAWNDYEPDADEARQPPRSSVATLAIVE